MRKRKKPTGLAGWFGQVVAWLVILTVAAMVTVGVLIPRLGGATPYTVLTGSMRPHLPPGTLVVIKPTPADEIGVGDVITYQLESGEPAVVTHRVVATSFNGKGEHIFRTQGDANNVADAKPVLEVQIRGKLWYAVPYLGQVNNAITGKERSLTLIIVVSGLLLYSAFMFTGALRDRTRKTEKAVAAS